jgi:hypothetical protein
MIGVELVDAPSASTDSGETALMPTHIWEAPSPEVAGLRRDSPEYRADTNRRLGLAYLSGAEK